MLTLSPLPNTGGTGAKFALQRHRTGAMLWLCWEETCQPLSSQHQLQPTLILLLHKWYVSSSEDFYKYQELTKHMKDGLNYYHSAVLIFTLPEHQTCKASAAPGAVSSINSADKCHPFWHHCLGKHLRDSRSATTCHLKAVTRNTLTGQILCHRNLWLSLRTVGSLWIVLKTSISCFHSALKTHSKLIYIISSALI